MSSIESSSWALPSHVTLFSVESILHLCLVALALTFIHLIGSIIYNIYLHPLAGYPGPLLGRSTLLWRFYHTMSGKIHISIHKQHEIYGSVFRVSPNELSFASVPSWKAIYGHQAAGKPTLVKGKFYEMYGGGFDSLCIGSERNPQKHSQMKKTLSAAFSTTALVEQESIVDSCVNEFIKRIGQDGTPGSKGLDMTKWYEMIAFDILGEMAFGESFHSVADGKPHFWSELVEDHLWFITLADNLRHYSAFVMLGRVIAPLMESVQKKHTGYTREMVSRRLGNKTSRKDFLTNLVGKVENGEVHKEELTAHVSTLIIAGGETVATFLAATTFYLMKTPQTYAVLCHEIRARYNSYEEIDSTSARQLPYLQAVISEGLRIYPPGSQGFPRVSPGATIDGHWVPEGVDVYTSAWTVTHDPCNFHEPMKFRPERWLDGDCKDVKEASQPFSLGPRGCLGRNFAYMEISLIIAKMIWTYDLELATPDLDWELQSKLHVMWSKPALPIIFHKRQ